MALTGRCEGHGGRAALMSAGTFAGLAGAGFVLATEDSAGYWFHALLDPSRVGGLACMANQSLRGVLHRINPGQPAETLLWVALSAIVVLLVSPVSWCHHWVWCVPAFLALGFVRRNWTRVVLVVVFSVQPVRWLPSTGGREMLWTWWQHLYGDAYTWMALVTLALAGRTRVTADR